MARLKKEPKRISRNTHTRAHARTRAHVLCVKSERISGGGGGQSHYIEKLSGRIQY